VPGRLAKGQAGAFLGTLRTFFVDQISSLNKRICAYKCADTLMSKPATALRSPYGPFEEAFPCHQLVP
jgi:hypothetical protein